MLIIVIQSAVIFVLFIVICAGATYFKNYKETIERNVDVDNTLKTPAAVASYEVEADSEDKDGVFASGGAENSTVTKGDRLEGKPCSEA